MLESIPPMDTQSWPRLAAHYAEIRDLHMRDLFAEDPQRFEKLSIAFDDMVVDFSKNRMTEQTLDLLMGLAKEAGLQDAIRRMFAGDKINATENRPVLHVALRNRTNRPIVVDGRDVMPSVNQVLDQMRQFSDNVAAGSWQGYNGKPVRDIVNIGIGGSDLGPAMVTECLKPYGRKNLSVHFVSNVDGTHLTETLRHLDPATTLFIIASKTFTTQETMTNAFSATAVVFGRHDRIRTRCCPGILWRFPPTCQAVEAFGIDRGNMFVSGTGSGGATPSGLPSASPLPAISGLTTSPTAGGRPCHGPPFFPGALQSRIFR
jgi:glucose-6-phosphate isomerase